jgi:RNA polymerase sigma factor (TIGR02999 family)
MELTELIRDARGGSKPAADRLFSLVYDDLHRLAARQLQPFGGMATTSLVHETYLKLARPEALALNDRQHFFAVAARAMRQIAINFTRDRLAAKRGGGAAVTTLGAADEMAATGDGTDLLALDAALEQLATVEPRLAQLVELRFFGGMGLDEAGAAIGLSPTTLKRDWRKARAFLHGAIGGEPG